MIFKFLSKDPLVLVIDDFLDEEDCEKLIELSKPSLKRALVTGDKECFISEGRTCSNALVKNKNGSNYLRKKLILPICELINLAEQNAENIQVVHYKNQQKYNLLEMYGDSKQLQMHPVLNNSS